MQCGQFPSGNREADTAPRIKLVPDRSERVSGGNWRSIIQLARFSSFSSRQLFTVRARWLREWTMSFHGRGAWRHCNNVVYTPKSNFVIRSVGRVSRPAIQRVYAMKLLSAGSTFDIWHRYDYYLMRGTEFCVNWRARPANDKYN